jgi:hypothetical protein
MIAFSSSITSAGNICFGDEFRRGCCDLQGDLVGNVFEESDLATKSVLGIYFHQHDQATFTVNVDFQTPSEASRLARFLLF